MATPRSESVEKGKRTALRIRGKRYPPNNGKRTASTAGLSEEDKKRDDKKDKGDAKAKRMLTAAVAKKVKKASVLHRLPIEVLERVFYESENLNLARCDPLLGRALSNRGVYVELVVAAFGPTWDCGFGYGNFFKSEPIPRGYLSNPINIYSERTLTCRGNPKFQSEVLKCGWAKLPLILEAQQLWFSRQKNTAPHQHIFPPAVLENSNSGVAGPPVEVDKTAHEDMGAYSHTPSIKNCFEAELAAFHTAVTMRNYFRNPSGRFHVGHFAVHPDVTIPDELIRGPFTRESHDRLFWLVLGGATQRPSQSFELVERGLEAIRREVTDHQLAWDMIALLELLGAFHRGLPDWHYYRAVDFIDSEVRRRPPLPHNGPGWMTNRLIGAPGDIENLDPESEYMSIYGNPSTWAFLAGVPTA